MLRSRMWRLLPKAHLDSKPIEYDLRTSLLIFTTPELDRVMLKPRDSADNLQRPIHGRIICRNDFCLLSDDLFLLTPQVGAALRRGLDQCLCRRVFAAGICANDVKGKIEFADKLLGSPVSHQRPSHRFVIKTVVTLT
jgi:hypothetical protein